MRRSNRKSKSSSERNRKRSKPEKRIKGERWEATICSETHLSWIVSVSAVEQGDAEAVRVCESLYGVLERKTKI